MMSTVRHCVRAVGYAPVAVLRACASSSAAQGVSAPLEIDVGRHGCSKASLRVGRGHDPSVNDEAASIEASMGPEIAVWGQDASFVTDTAFGVADGVGGWKKHKVNPAYFAARLMQGCAERIGDDSCGADTLTAERYRECLADVHREIVESPNKQYFGASTACLVFIEPIRGVMNGVNLGDSGWRIIRDGDVMAASQDQRHSVFTPWQLCKRWPDLDVIDDDPTVADTQDIEIQAGDVIVVASDGLYDNLYDNEIAELVVEDPDMSAAEVAKELVNAAVPLMQQKDVVSPFSSRASDEGFFVMGGKVDDIVVCVAKISAEQASTARLAIACNE